MLKSLLGPGLTILSAVLLVSACTPPQTEATSESQTESIEQLQSSEPAESAAPKTVSSALPPDTTASTISRTGVFVSGEHETQGDVTLISQGDTQTLVFNETFSTSSGPDLVVVLHRSANVLEETTPPAYPLVEGDYLVLAPLSAITGTQEYAISANVDTDDYQSVAIWCQEFNATFGAALLN